MAKVVNTALLESTSQTAINAMTGNSSIEELIWAGYTSNTIAAASYYSNSSSLPTASANTKSLVAFVANVGIVYSSNTAWYSSAGAILDPEDILFTWGSGTKGGLGDNNLNTRYSPGTTAGGGTNWTQIGLGDRIGAAIKADGTLWTWGANYYGALGDGTTTSRSSPGTTAGGGTNWSKISSSLGHMAAIKTDGTLWTWGYNLYGNLGTGNTTSRSSPGTTAGGGTNWSQVAAGTQSLAAIKTDGTLWTWGRNSSGQLGDGSITDRSSPGTVTGGGTTWSQIAGLREAFMSIKTDGTLWTWGNNGYGQLGQGTTANRSIPATVQGGGTNWGSILHQVSTYYATAAIKTDGTLWTWGYNGNYQLGTGDNVSRSSPGQTISGGTDWLNVAVGRYTMCALKTNGTLWGWGSNPFGTIGNNTTSGYSYPTLASVGTGWLKISSGYNHNGGIFRGNYTA